MNTTVDHVACAACGIICEDITVRTRDGVITEVENACRVCRAQLLGQSLGGSHPPEVGKAINILANARAPLIYGLAGSSVEAQRAAIALAETLGGTIDVALPDFHRASLQAMQSVGISTCTLGELRQRADVIVFWGGDPTQTHPRLLERLINPPRQFVTDTRCVIHVGARPCEFSADDSLQIDAADSLATLAFLRAAAANKELSPSNSHSERLRQLATRLLNAEYSVILFGPELGGFAEIESLFRLVRQLNTRSRCAAIALGGTQIENVLTWQTGYPYAVNFALGYPRYDPDRYSANSLLDRGEVDAVVLIGSEGNGELSSSAQKRLAQLPVVHLGFFGSRPPSISSVDIAVARPGVHCEGIVFRMDGVPIKLQPVFDSPLPTSEAILYAIQQGVCASCV